MPVPTYLKSIIIKPEREFPAEEVAVPGPNSDFALVVP